MSQDHHEFENNPAGWFVELLLSVDRGDFDRAAHAQRELDRLGWVVTRKKRRKPATRDARGVEK